MKKHQITISSPEPMNVQQTEQGFTVTYGNTPPEQISISMQSEGGEAPKPSFKKWRAKEGSRYFVNAGGDICCNTERGDKYDNYYYLTNNYFQTEQEAKSYKSRQEAIGRVTHAIVEANEGWEHSSISVRWIIDTNQRGEYIYVDWVNYGYNSTFLPHCKTKNIALSIISSHKEDLDLIFNVKK